MGNLLGVVLCGGESKRMGTDKGLIEKNGKTWAQVIGDKLQSAGLEVLYSINAQQLHAYQSYIPPDRLIIDNIEIHGPLKGLLSVHETHSDRDILLMACDLIEMDEKTLSVLIEHYQSNATSDFVVYQHEFAEPFCAIYTSRGLQPVLDRARKHQLAKFSFQSIFEDGNTSRLPVLNSRSFNNYNTIPGHHRE